MIFYLLFFYLLSESMAADSYDVSNKIICYYQGVIKLDGYLVLDPQNILSECDAILYGSLYINQSSMIDVDEELLVSLTDLEKPIIVALMRTEMYSGWNAILDENGNAYETKMLCDFAKTYNIKGYVLTFLSPDINEGVDKNVAKNIIPYIQHMKELCPFLIIGVSISPVPEILKNKDVYNFEELNKVVTYFDIETTFLNDCNPKLYNGLLPITKSDPGDNYLYGLEEVVSNLKETKINMIELTFSIPLLTTEIKNHTNPPYSYMCDGRFDSSTWCVQTSQNYYDKGNYLRDQKIGIRVVGLEWDDYDNTCECQSEFNGFHNIVAGYKGGKVISCSKFDVQSTAYSIK